MKWILVLAAIGLGGTGCAAAESKPSPGCVVVRAAFDVGSSTTKVKVARVDRCAGRIVEVLMDESQPVGYQQDLEATKANELSAPVRREGRTAMVELHAAAQAHEPVQTVGVATSAFRQARNGEAFLQSLREEMDIELRIIDERTEARLGFHAAVSKAGVDPAQAVVWDIGGGSMQLVALDVSEQGDRDGDTPRYHHHKGNTSSVRFRDRIIRELQARDVAKADTPNPITPEIARQALAMARDLAGELPEAMARRLRRPEAALIGIGGVHYHSIRGQLETGDRPYRRGEVAATLEQRLNMTDEQIGGPFADTEVSNLILVLGHMQAWDVDTVRPVDVNMSDGLLLAAE